MLWKIFNYSGIKRAEIDHKQLKKRLQAIMKQNNVEIMQLAIQSILEELNEGVV